MSIALETEECDRIWRTIISSHRRAFNEVLTSSGDGMGRAGMDVVCRGTRSAPEMMLIALETGERNWRWRRMISSYQRTFNEVLTISGDGMGRAEMDIPSETESHEPRHLQLENIETARRAHEREQDRLERQRIRARERRARLTSTQSQPPDGSSRSTRVPIFSQQRMHSPLTTSAAAFASAAALRIPADICSERASPDALQALLPPHGRGRPSAEALTSRRTVIKAY